MAVGGSEGLIDNIELVTKKREEVRVAARVQVAVIHPDIIQNEDQGDSR